MNFLLHILITLVLLACTESHRILFLGDSNDRFVALEWHAVNIMRGYTSQACSRWLNGETNSQTHFFCQLTDHSLSNVFLYGSSDGPPYHLGRGEAPQWHTKNLLPLAINIYFQKFGAPDTIYYHSCLWDVAYYYYKHEEAFPGVDREEIQIKHSAVWNQTLTKYEGNIRKRIQDVLGGIRKNSILFNVSHPINVGLRSLVYNSRRDPGHKQLQRIIPYMNLVMQRLAEEYNLTFFDYDRELWSIFDHFVNKTELLFRDHGHPRTMFASAAGDKLLGLRYTSNLVIRGPINLHAYYPRVCLLHHPRPQSLSADLIHPHLQMQGLRSAARQYEIHHMQNKHSHIPKEYDQPIEFTSSAQMPAVPSYYCDIRKMHVSNLTKVFLLSSWNTSSPIYYLQYPETLPPLSPSHHFTTPGAWGLQRIGPISRATMRLLNLSPDEILRIVPSDVELIPISQEKSHLVYQLEAISTSRSDFAIFNSTLGQIYIYFIADQLYRRYDSPVEGLQYFDGRAVAQGVSLDILLQLTQGPPLPNIYYEHSLVQVKKQMYVLLNGSTHLIPKEKVFLQYGWNKTELKSVSQWEFERIPRGDPLSDSG